MERESLIGVWDMLAGPVHSEVVVNPDGTYRHAFWPGGQSHWGAWSLQEQDGHTTLRMELHGAQPLVTFGPIGVTPVPWPATEQWVITAVQPDQVQFYGALMVRRFIGAPQNAPPLWATGPPPMPPQVPTAPAPPVVDYAALRRYSAPPPAPPPGAHSATILSQWQALSPQEIVNQAKANAALLTAQADANREMLDAHLQATQKTQALFHQNAQRFSKMMNP